MTANEGVNGTTVGFENRKTSTSENDASGRANIRRKALGDASNVRKSDVSDKVVCIGSKPMKYQSEGFTSLQRVLVDPSIRKAGVAKEKSFVVTITLGGVAFVLMTMSCVGSVFVYIIMLETRGKTLDEM